jgi:hypothetical protein
MSGILTVDDNRVIAKSDSIRTLGTQVNALLTRVNGPNATRG